MSMWCPSPQRLLELEELEVVSSSSSAAPVVKLDGVALSWSEDKDKKVVSGVSFSVAEVRVHHSNVNSRLISPCVLSRTSLCWQ